MFLSLLRITLPLLISVIPGLDDDYIRPLDGVLIGPIPVLSRTPSFRPMEAESLSRAMSLTLPLRMAIP